jgi:hypothetical protein
MRDGRRNRTMMRARQRRVDLQRIRKICAQNEGKRKRMRWYEYVVHNAPSFDAPDITVCAVLDFKSDNFQVRSGVYGGDAPASRRQSSMHV